MTLRIGRFICRAVGASCWFLLLPLFCWGQETTLTLDQALDLARTRAQIRATRRRYRDDTLILETTFETAEGEVTLIDCMAVRE